MGKGKKIKYPVHKMGKSYGCEEFEDGSIKIAPALAQIIDNLQNREAAIKRILSAVTNECSEIMVEIVKESNNFWEKIAHEYGFDRENKAYVYNRTESIVRLKPENKVILKPEDK